MGRELNNVSVFKILSSKGVKIDTSGGLFLHLDNAKDLGNRSWGYIDFLKSDSGAVVTGMAEYRKRNFVNKSDDDKPRKKKRDEVDVEGIKKLHTLEGILPQYEYKGSKVRCSEYDHLVEINHFINKFNRSVFAKTEKERKAVNKAAVKDNLTIPFTNETVFQWTSDNKYPNKIINKAQRKEYNHKQLQAVI